MSFTTHLISAATHAGVISAANVMRKGVGSAYRVYDAATIPDASPSLKVVARRESIVLGVTFLTNMTMQLGIVPLKKKLGKWYAPVQLGFDMLSLVFSEAFSRRHTYKDVKQNHIKPTLPPIPPVTLPNVAIPKNFVVSSLSLAGSTISPSNVVLPTVQTKGTHAVNTVSQKAATVRNIAPPTHLGAAGNENPFQYFTIPSNMGIPQKASEYEALLARSFGAQTHPQVTSA
jgi:hypothetical protein